MKKLLIILICLAQNYWSVAQSNIEQEFEVSRNQKIALEFDEANIVQVIEWEGKNIRLQAKVSINENTQNDAYKIVTESDQNQLIISGLIENKDELPSVIRIKKGDEIFTFQTDDWNDVLIKEFYQQYGDEGIQWKSHGVSWEIDIIIQVPRTMEIEINSKHGMVELVNLSGTVTANSIHGGIDLTVNNNSASDINVKTKWGMIYSNLKLDIDNSLSSNDDWNHIVGTTAGQKSGTTFDLESKHANIYLRH